MNEIQLYGNVGEALTTKSIVDQLNTMDGDIKLRVNSPGGNVYEGVGIMNALRAYNKGTITAIIEGMAASAASFIVVGGATRIVARPHAEVMIHEAAARVAGSAADMTRGAADLERLSEKIASIYAERTGGEAENWRDLMRAETWFSAQEALDAGLIDAVEDAREHEPIAGVKQPVFATALAQYKYAGRAAAPAPAINAHDGQKGDTVSIQNLAQELGVEPEKLREKLTGFFNEQVAVTGEVDVTYPADNPIAPTERVTVEPVVGDTTEDAEPQNAITDVAALGLTFAIGTAPDEWDVTVDETTGVVTAKAPNGAEVGETVEVTVRVNDSTDVVCTFKVKAVSEDADGGDTDGEEPAPAEPVNDVEDMVMVPRSVWNEYVADRAQNAARIEAEKQRELEAKVDGHIREGRYSAALRGEAIASYQRDPELAEQAWGSLPKNTAVPVAEIGHSAGPEKLSKADELREKARANRLARANRTNKED